MLEYVYFRSLYVLKLNNWWYEDIDILVSKEKKRFYESRKWKIDFMKVMHINPFNTDTKENLVKFIIFVFVSIIFYNRWKILHLDNFKRNQYNANKYIKFW